MLGVYGRELGAFQRASVFEARSLYLAGDYPRCLDMLDLLPPSPEGGLLRSRNLLRLGRSADARLLLSNTEPSQQTAAEQYCALAIACTRLGDFAGAHDAMQECLRRSRNTTLDRSYYGYGSAFALWGEEKHEEARRFLTAVTAPDLRPNALELLGWIERANGNNAAAARCFLKALHASMLTPTPDMYVRAMILWALAYLVGEIYLPEAVAEIQRGIASLPDSPGIAVPKFQAYRNAGWCLAQVGNFSEAFRYIRKALDLAPNNAWRVTVLCDRAQLALGIREHPAAVDLLEEAIEAANAIAWMETSNEERIGLLFLAHLLAGRDSVKAQQYIATYDSLAPMDPTLFHNRDNAARAFEHFVRGSVEHGADATSASAHYAQAHRLYKKIGFEWRAILVAVAKDDLAGKTLYNEYIEHQLRCYPNSWILSLLSDRMAERKSRQQFSECQLEVLRGVHLGRTDKQIAQERGRSVSTVRDHLNKLRSITGTKNRTELAAYCVRHELFPDKNRH